MNKDLPKISIVTPSFNQARFLEATIQSILSQNYTNLEYSIIDGGSTDGSIEIIKKYEKYISFWSSEPDLGQYDAINKGFKKSSGDIMAWLNSDDMYCPWALKTVASIFLDNPQIKWLTTLTPCIWDWHGYCARVLNIPGFSRKAFMDGGYVPWNKMAIGWIQQESTFWKRSLWEKVDSCISIQFKFAGDFDLWAKFYTHADLYGTVSPLGGFRRQLNQRSTQRQQYLIDAEKSLERMRNTFEWHPSSISRNIIINLRMYRIPKIREIIKSIYGYTGKRVIRRNDNSPDGFWGIEEYNFFYD